MYLLHVQPVLTWAIKDVFHFLVQLEHQFAFAIYAVSHVVTGLLHFD